MSPQEATELIHSNFQEKRRLLESLVTPTRAAVNVLKDLGHHATARDLEAILFQLDANEQELSEIIKREPAAFMQGFIEMMRKP